MNSKSVFVLLLVGSLFLVAVLTRRGEVLLLVMPFLAYFVVGLLQAPEQLNLRARRIIQRPEVTAQAPVEIQVQVRNDGSALPNLLLADPMPPGLRVVEGQAKRQLALLSGDTTQWQFTVSGARGLYHWDDLLVRASDPLGLFELRQNIPCPAEIQVRPASVKLRNVLIRPRSTLHAPGPTPSRLAGPGTDFWEVRDYHAGDARRRINWRLASRHPGRLFTNEYEGEEIADFGFILDARGLSNLSRVNEAVLESSVSAVASLSEAFLNKGNRVALLIFGEAPISVLPGYGKHQLHLVLRELARVRPSRALPSRYLEYFPARLFPTRSTLILFSSLDAGDLDTFRRLRSFGYEILLVSPDPVEVAGKFLATDEVNALALRAARLERAVMLKAIMDMGVTAIDWQVDQPLDARLQSAAREMAHRRNL